MKITWEKPDTSPLRDLENGIRNMQPRTVKPTEGYLLSGGILYPMTSGQIEAAGDNLVKVEGK